MFLSVAILLLVSLHRCQATIGGVRNEIKLNDNGYEDILIAIENSVPEDSILLTRIQEHFTAASELLFTATNRRTYFRNFTILVPGSWTAETYDDAGTEDYSTANVVIHNDGPRGVFPFTRQYRECGKGGEQIFFFSNYMNTSAAQLQQLGGAAASIPHDKTIVHEWTHFRYGAFDEYPMSGDDKFYIDNGNYKPVACGKNIDGGTEGNCTSDSTGLHTSCKFLPNSNTPGVTASLMYDTGIPDITGFCDNDPISFETLHNENAPNRQNRFCEGRSVWEVMRNHSDFLGEESPQITTAPTPQFNIVRATPDRIILILDISGSMGGEKLDRLRQDAALYLMEGVPINSYVGIVTFETVASTAQSAILVNSSNSRDRLVNALPNAAGGWTCIGCGLERGVQVLEEADLATENARFLVITDGEENESPTVLEVLPRVKARGIKVDAFRYTERADSVVVSLAKATGGLAFFASHSSNSTALLDSFLATSARRQEPSSSSFPVQLALMSVEIHGQEEAHLTAAVDSTVGNETRFSFTYPAGYDPPFDVAVISPSGDSFSSDGSHATLRANIGLLTVQIPGSAEQGIWNIIISNNKNSSVRTEMVVVSHPSAHGVSPYRVTATIQNDNVFFNSNQSNKPVVIYAEVTQGHVPVIRAKVSAVIDNLDKPLPLYDNGVGSDLFKDDGIYSAYFVEFPRNGKFAVRVEVSSTNETAILGGQVFSPAPMSGQVDTLDISKVSEDFQRLSSAGFMSVDNLPPDSSDLYPPARVNDLTVTQINNGKKTVTLSWTAVGDDFDHGQASKYELRLSTSSNQLRFDYDNCAQVEEDQIIDGSLSRVQPSLSEEIFHVNMSSREENTTYYFALRVWDEANRVSQISNLVSVAFLLPYEVETSTESEGLTSESTESEGLTSERTESEGLTSESTESVELTTEIHNETVTGEISDELLGTTAKVSIGLGCGIASVIIVAVAVTLVYKCTVGSKRHNRNMHYRSYQNPVLPTANLKAGFGYGQTFAPSVHTRSYGGQPSYDQRSRMPYDAYNNPVYAHTNTANLYRGSQQSLSSFPLPTTAYQSPLYPNRY